jgi:antitoxin component YwqK of YwqJK toxin-antitoxin module
MKPLILLFALTAIAAAVPPIRITNREFPDGSGSSREIDPSKRESVETFYDSRRRVTRTIRYKLDERLQPVSAILYNANGVIYQKSSYKLDGEDRVIQEVIYDAKGNLLGTKNYNYGTRNGSAIVINVDTYDANGNLIQTPRLSKSGKKSK